MPSSQGSNDASLVLPDVQAGLHQATLHDTLGVLGWTASADEEGPSGVVTIPTIAYRLSKQFLPALLHAEDEILSASAGVRGDEEDTDSNSGALISLLGDLSSAAAMAHNARGHSSSSSIAEPDSAAEESNSNSSYPTSPETRLRRLDISHDQDNDESNEEILNDSPPTTPSQTSSSDDLSKPYTTSPARPTHQHHHVAFRNILQERLGGIDMKQSSVGFPRSNTIDTISSGVSSPVSHRSRASSIRSTASSIFERMCGQPKSKTTVSLHAEPQSTMGSFTPVSAKTASTSLRRFGIPAINGGSMWRARTRSRLGMPPEFWESSDDAGVESDSAAPSPSKPIVRRHARSATIEVPSISMTHASFRPDSMLDVAVPPTASPTSSSPRAPRPPVPSPVTPAAQSRPQARVRMSSKPSAPIPSISSVLAARPTTQLPQRAATDPISGPTRGLPKMDPTLAALEKGCRLKAKVSCAQCAKVGWDFPKNRQGQALCSRECRMAFKAQSEGKGKGREGAVVLSVGA
ncbi:hypothetical protein FRC00_001274 [Tulasnella sp. 408]|nr:hypothetical protein FRC00_001274 [Tulasnella sp. 408]